MELAVDGFVEFHEARLVAQGYIQQRGMDYDETLSPVVCPESVRTLILVATARAWWSIRWV